MNTPMDMDMDMNIESYTPAVWGGECIVVRESNAGHIAFVADAWAAILPPISAADHRMVGTLLESLWQCSEWIVDYINENPDDRLAQAGDVENWTVIAEQIAGEIYVYPHTMGRSGKLFAFGSKGVTP